MERSRSKRNFYYDQDYDSPPNGRIKQRYHHHHHHNNNRHSNRNFSNRISKQQQQQQHIQDSPSYSTCFRILCPDIKAGSVIGKSGSIIKAYRQETGAWINVHQLLPGDEERIIEISDARRYDQDGLHSPAQEALLMIHERILEFDNVDCGEGDEEYVRNPRVATRLVVPRNHVGCLLGKGGKIIEQMRQETKTHIRILPREQHYPRCVSMSEEIVQIVGDATAVKKAVLVISTRLKESPPRERAPFFGRSQSPERYFPSDEDFSHMNNTPRRPSLDGSSLGVRPISTSYVLQPYLADNAQPSEELVFRILCPNDKVDGIMKEPGGLIELLQNEVGVKVGVNDHVPGSDERIITITAEEIPEDYFMFPAQEALLHIQSHIADLGDKDNIIVTRLLVPSSEIGCLDGRDGSLSEIRRLTRTNVQILPRERHPPCVSGEEELVQITGEIIASREALNQVTNRLKSYLFREISFSRDSIPPPPSAPGHVGSMFVPEDDSSNKNSTQESYQGSGPPSALSYQNVLNSTTPWLSKDSGGCGDEPSGYEEAGAYEEAPSGAERLRTPLVTKSTLEVVIPAHAIPSLILRSGTKLAQISEKSGATVTLLEERPGMLERVVQISGTPEQAERAQSLLEGFILSTQEDTPTS